MATLTVQPTSVPTSTEPKVSIDIKPTPTQTVSTNVDNDKNKFYNSNYNGTRNLRFYERFMDDLQFRLREMRYPLHTWKLRHYVAVYILSRFVLRPIMYYPGILSFYYIQPGRRFNEFFQAVPVILPKIMSERFWVSGAGQGWIRTPFNSTRWKEACGDFAVFLSLTWPLWLWTRFYYSYFLIEWAKHRSSIIPNIKDIHSNLQWTGANVVRDNQ